MHDSFWENGVLNICNRIKPFILDIMAFECRLQPYYEFRLVFFLRVFSQSLDLSVFTLRVFLVGKKTPLSWSSNFVIYLIVSHLVISMDFNIQDCMQVTMAGANLIMDESSSKNLHLTTSPYLSRKMLRLRLLELNFGESQTQNEILSYT